MKINTDIHKNITYLKEQLPIDQSFDIIGRDLIINNQKSYLLFIDGFAKDDVMIHVLKELQKIEQSSSETLMKDLVEKYIPYIEAEINNKFEDLIKYLLSGSLLLFVDGQDDALIIDAREYPVRSIEEADTEKVTNGSKDGFVETIIFNTALIRRRIRDPKLTFEMKSVGKKSKTDVCLAYIDDSVEKDFLETLRNKIDSINVDSLIMAEKSLEELLVKKKWYNPFPQMRYTQRPDIAASYLYEGHVIIIVDTSPSVMITPSTFLYFTQYAEDYIQEPIIGNYYRFLRFLSILVSVLLVPTWLLLATHPEYLPDFLSFIGVKEANPTFSLLTQFIILEFFFDLLKISSLHTPGYLGSAFSIMGGLLISELAITVGFFTAEPVFYIAITTISSYCIPNSDLTNACRIIRLILLIFTGVFGLYGYIGILIATFLLMLTTNTIDKHRPYLWPIIPFNLKALIKLLARKKVQNKQ